MAKLTIEGVLPYDGEYEVDLADFTNRELHLIREFSGLRPPEILDGIDYRDSALMVAIANIALARDGHDSIESALLWDASFTKIKLDLRVEGGVPLDETNGSPPAESGSEPSVNTESSGPASSDDGDPAASDPTATGDPG